MKIQIAKSKEKISTWIFFLNLKKRQQLAQAPKTKAEVQKEIPCVHQESRRPQEGH